MPDKPDLSLTPRRDKTINVRIDSDLYDSASEKAQAVGVAAIVRALLRAYVRGAVEPPNEDLSKELQWAPRLRQSRRKPHAK